MNSRFTIIGIYTTKSLQDNVNYVTLHIEDCHIVFDCLKESRLFHVNSGSVWETGK